MAQAAEKTPLEGDLREDEKMQDSDSGIQPAHEIRNETSQQSQAPSMGSPPDRFPVGQNTSHKQAPVSGTTNVVSTSSDSTLAQPASGSANTATARTHWDASDVWGTQSYGQSNKACAMCAQHIE